MFVRTASQRDLRAIHDLLAASWHASHDAICGDDGVAGILQACLTPDIVRGWLTAPRSECLVADDGTTLGGVAFAVADASGQTVELQQLHVRPELCGRGIGSALLEEVFDSFPEAERVRVSIAARNERGAAFLHGYGFEQPQSAVPATDAFGIALTMLERRLA